MITASLTASIYRLIHAYVGKTKKHQQLILLDPEKAALLARLARDSRIPRQALLREAVDDLLKKYKLLKPKRKP